MAFSKGRSGNPGGRPKEKLFRDALTIAVKETEGDKTKLRKLAEQLVTLGVGGDVQAILAVRDTLDGKPAQDVMVSGDPDAPLVTRGATEKEIDEQIAQLLGKATALSVVDPEGNADELPQVRH